MLWKKKKKLKKLQTQQQEAERKLQNLKDTIQIAQDKLNITKVNLDNAQKEYNDFQKQMGIVETYGTLEEVGVDYTAKLESTDVLEQKLINAEQAIGEMVKNGKALYISREYRIDGSSAKGATFQKNYGKNLLIGLNAVYGKQMKSRTIAYSKSKETIIKAKEKFNKQGKLIGIVIADEYVNLLIDALKIKRQLQQAKAEEQELLRQEKQRLKEQEKLLEELAKEREKIAKERRYYEATIEDCDDEKREAIKAKLADLDKRDADVNYRERNQRAGWLYVTHTNAMPNMTKVGVTRRYLPTIRLQELSSASVPFPFECDGLVFSDDAFELETKVHSFLNYCRVNKENRHKEFFEIEPKAVVQILQNHFGCKIIYLEEDKE